MDIDAPALRAEHLSKAFWRAGHRILAVQDVAFHISPGDIVGLLGPNGSGKTTLIKMLVGLCVPDQGRVAGPAAAGIGLALENRPNLSERLSTLENARYACSLRGCRFEQGFFDELALTLGVPDVACPVRQLSSGAKGRSALLCILIARPDFLLLDEPTLGLDLFGVEVLLQLVRRLASNGCGCLISSHDVEFVERVCSSVLCLQHGRVVFHGSKEDFTTGQWRYALTMTVAAADLPPTLLAFRPIAMANRRVRFLLRSQEELCRLMGIVAELGELVGDIDVRSLTLRDHYRALLGCVDDAEANDAFLPAPAS